MAHHTKVSTKANTVRFRESIHMRRLNKKFRMSIHITGRGRSTNAKSKKRRRSMS